MKKISAMLTEELLAIVKKVQKKTGVVFGANEVGEILSHTRRKCSANGKGVSYIPILFETELLDYVLMDYISMKGTKCIV